MCILLVKLIKKLQNIILPDALLTWANQLLVKFGSDRESNIPYLSVFTICSALPLERLGPILNQSIHAAVGS